MYAVLLGLMPLVSSLACLESHAGGRAQATTQPAVDVAILTAEALALRESWAGGLIGSKHDFSQGGATPRDLCLTCHTPHITAARAPLLEAAPRSRRAVALRTVFGEELNRASLLCLSCHDGVTARDVYTGTHATALASQLGAQFIDVRPLASHPIGRRYPLADSTYRGTAEVQADGRIKLPAGRVQCTSCHDPHNTERHPWMLVKSNDRSALCLSCHRK